VIRSLNIIDSATSDGKRSKDHSILNATFDKTNIRKLNRLGTILKRRMTASRTYIVFAFLCLLSTGILWHPFAVTLSLALRDDGATHILLILPISLALIFSERSSLTPSASSGAVATASLLFAAGILIATSMRWWLGWVAPDLRLAAGMLLLVTLWITDFVLCFGTRVTGSLLFPLSFLLLMVPIPSFLLIKIVHLLQQGSALAAWMLFSTAGVPASRDGIFVYIPGLTVEVARECSSIRSSIVLLITTIVLSHVLLNKLWRKILVVLLAVPLSVAKNGMRIFILGMLGTRVDRSYLTGRLHHEGGVIFFLIALLLISLLLWLLRRGEETLVYTATLSVADRESFPSSSLKASR
jgi:exosortase